MVTCAVEDRKRYDLDSKAASKLQSQAANA
jgi:hypothetical protein